MALAPAEGRLTADTSVTLDRVRKGEVVDFVLGRHFTIESAEAHGASVSIGPTLTPWAGLQRIRLTFAQAQRAPKLRVRYAGKPSPGGEPPINMITPKLVELSLDGMWVPIRADLEGRFTADALISGLPRDATVVAQGRVSREGAAYRIRRDRPGVDLPLIAAPGLKRLAGGKFELLARDPDNEQARLYRKHAPAALAFLERWFGPVPGAPLRLVIVARERRSGYNRPGYVVFTETGKAEEAGTAKFTAHEFAHAWFSNANATTEHRWIDESIAEYVSLRYLESTLGLAARDKMLEAKRETARTAKPILGGMRGDPELYAKGPVLLFDLERRLGRAAMDRLIAKAAHEKAGRTERFVALLRAEGGAEAARWFEEQLRS
jgi:hypothetical protein